MGSADERRFEVLRAIVADFVATKEPIGSKSLVERHNLGVSSATVRNDMVLLEQDGYLQQPHTSAGRVPTEKGYRFFVDSLEAPGPLEPSQRQQVKQFFARAHGEIEHVLNETSRLLSDLTDHTAVVVGPHHDRAAVRSVQLVSLTARVVLVVVVLSDGAVEKRTLELRNDIGEERVAAAAAHLGRLLMGFTLLTAIRPGPGTGDSVTDDVVGAALLEE